MIMFSEILRIGYLTLGENDTCVQVGKNQSLYNNVERKGVMKTYILYDTYETGVDLGEEIGCYNSYEEMRKAARQRIEDTDGECRLQYVVIGE